ncbi:hypothetical protein [uncultured Oscillibacter sp.]|uniref:hypothetical protein n=1 Tax=uncultured Oscillibacter sp. TaxID=876091 RepID=UPI0025D213EA|nr:hypothetical protein [uncultured Oscillibacter sp.]
MEQYRFDPYTGQPLPQARPASSRTWLSGVPQTPPTPPPQPPARQEQPGVIFRQVASLDEAKAVPTDFSGALTIMPDWAHGYIYAKALGDDGSPIFRSYRYEPPQATTAAPVPIPEGTYAPLETVECLRCEVEKLRQELDTLRPPVKEAAVAEKPAGKGNKS